MEKKLKIKGTELPYTIDEIGRIFNIRMNRLTKTFINKGKRGLYERVKVEYNNKKYRDYVHRLVAEHFKPHPNSDNLEINHKDGNTLNNNAHNLFWCTHSENVKHWSDNLKGKRPRPKEINHRKIYERELGVKIKKGNHIHHIDGNNLNDHIDNLIEVTHKEHNWLHRKENEYLKTYTREEIRKILNNSLSRTIWKIN
jgi:hypothetical protein